MFSLIITIISIALVAALAVASIYYGGDALSEGRADAAAATLVNQYQQIQGAADIYRAQKMEVAADIAALVDADLLQAAPKVSTDITAESWEMDGGVITIAGLQPAVCRAVDTYAEFACTTDTAEPPAEGSNTFALAI